MVWSTTQSALYNDLSRYYEDEKRPRKNYEDPDRISDHIEDKFNEKIPEICDEKLPGKIPQNCEEKFGNNCDGNPKNDRAEKCPPVCPNCPRIRQPSNAQNNQISRLISEKFSDRDMLLIAGLIFLLMKQGADRKLILALAFVLLS